MGCTVADVALLLEVIAGKDPLDPRQGEVPVQPYSQVLGKEVKGLRVGMLREGFGLEGAEPEVDAAVRDAMNVAQALGMRVQEISVPPHREAGAIFWGIVAEGTAALMNSNGVGYHWKGLYNVSLATALGEFRRVRGNGLPPTLKLALLIGTYLQRRYPGRFYGKAQNLRRALQSSYDRALEQVDVLAMPTTPIRARRVDPKKPRRDVILDGWNHQGNTAPFDATGHPALSLPCATVEGLPVGLMLVGRYFEEGTLFRVADALSKALPTATAPPLEKGD